MSLVFLLMQTNILKNFTRPLWAYYIFAHHNCLCLVHIAFLFHLLRLTSGLFCSWLSTFIVGLIVDVHLFKQAFELKEAFRLGGTRLNKVSSLLLDKGPTATLLSSGDFWFAFDGTADSLPTIAALYVKICCFDRLALMAIEISSSIICTSECYTIDGILWSALNPFEFSGTFSGLGFLLNWLFFPTIGDVLSHEPNLNDWDEVGGAGF